MFVNKLNFIYVILLTFSVYCTGILATDCDVYKKIVGNSFSYKERLDKANGNCCISDFQTNYHIKCDSQNNIISM